MLEALPVAIVVFDTTTREVVSLNQEARRIVFGERVPVRHQNELLSELVLRRLNGQDVLPENLPTQRPIRAGETVRTEEFALHLPDGRVVQVLGKATAIRKEDGVVVTVVGTLQDINPSDDSAKQRIELLNKVSLELRNPLACIKGSVSSLLGSSSPFVTSDGRQFLRIIDQQADNMSNLISSLVRMSRIEEGMAAVEAGPGDSEVLIKEARRAFATSGARNIVTVNITQHLPQVFVDRQSIKQVLINLFSRASRSSADWAEITVKASLEEHHVVIAVSDEGTGFAPDQLPHVFRKHFQFDTVPQHEPGLRDTLDLSICRGIVEAHGGRIWAESDGLGRGATFTFTIPLAKQVSRRSAPNRVHLSSDAGGDMSVSARVLVVDDDPHTLRPARKTLLRAGYTPIVTSDPEEALKLAKIERLDLALLDFTLVETQRGEFVKRVVDVVNAPVIFLLDHDGDELIARALGAGAEDYIVKPFSPSELTARIYARVRRRRALTSKLD